MRLRLINILGLTRLLSGSGTFSKPICVVLVKPSVAKDPCKAPYTPPYLIKFLILQHC